MRDYELTVLFGEKLSEKELDKEVKSLSELLSKNGAKITKKTDPEKKVLAYRVGNSTSGWYVFFEIGLPTDKVSALEEKLKVTENVIRHLLVRKEYGHKITK